MLHILYLITSKFVLDPSTGITHENKSPSRTSPSELRLWWFQRAIGVELALAVLGVCVANGALLRLRDPAIPGP